MRLQRGIYNSREYIVLRKRDEPGLQPHQIGIELVDTKTFETLKVPLDEEQNIQLLPQLPSVGMFTDIHPLEPLDTIPFEKRDISFLIEIRRNRDSLRRDAKKITKSKKSTQQILDEALAGTGPKVRKPRTTKPKDPNAPKRVRRSTKVTAPTNEEFKQQMMRDLGLL